MPGPDRDKWDVGFRRQVRHVGNCLGNKFCHDTRLYHRCSDRGEARHELVGGRLFFANRGEVHSGDAEEIMKGE
jgi:hypothetical protein